MPGIASSFFGGSAAGASQEDLERHGSFSTVPPALHDRGEGNVPPLAVAGGKMPRQPSFVCGSAVSSRQASCTAEDFADDDARGGQPWLAHEDTRILRNLTPNSVSAFRAAGFPWDPRPEEVDCARRIGLLELTGRFGAAHISAGVQLARIGINDFTAAQLALAVHLQTFGYPFTQFRRNELEAAQRVGNVLGRVEPVSIGAAMQLAQIGVPNFTSVQLELAARLQTFGYPQFGHDDLEAAETLKSVFDSTFDSSHMSAGLIFRRIYPGVALSALYQQGEKAVQNAQQELNGMKEYIARTQMPDVRAIAHKEEMLNEAKAETLKERVLTVLALQKIMRSEAIQGGDINAATWYFKAMNHRSFSLSDLHAIQFALRFPSRAGFGVDVVRHILNPTLKETKN
jgi:hypothetical protein